METKIRKYLKGEASREEMLELIIWLDSQENQAEFKRIKNDWKVNWDEQAIAPYLLQELGKFQSRILNERAGEIRKLDFLQKLYKYAAVLLLMVAMGGGYLYFSHSAGYAVSYNTLIADNAQISKAILPDQTVVWLNSGSSLKYSNQFGIENRDVELTGQAYFDVAKNKKLPFIVSCDEINVKVRGTRFIAEAYPDSPEISIVLEEGAVELVPASGGKSFAYLKPNEMMVYNKQDHQFNIREVVATKYSSWREGVIHIYDQPLKDVAAKLQKRYNQQIIPEEGLKDYKVTFSIRNEDFNDVLSMLLAITSAKAHQEGDTIYLKKGK
ncbi:MAG: FecR domain-containing protein [Prolixibacteraceae bacterium]|jgi:ferric-dicitrate binding protein FerR (iron transport regulator)|nr:FecR domain-containing protein [Prolixibacteraceae bacterium]